MTLINSSRYCLLYHGSLLKLSLFLSLYPKFWDFSVYLYLWQGFILLKKKGFAKSLLKDSEVVLHHCEGETTAQVIWNFVCFLLSRLWPPDLPIEFITQWHKAIYSNFHTPSHSWNESRNASSSVCLYLPFGVSYLRHHLLSASFLFVFIWLLLWRKINQLC